MAENRDRDPKIVKAKFVLYLARDMLFNNPPGRNTKTYKKYTKCEKISYKKIDLHFLDQMECRDGSLCINSSGKIRAVAIKLDGITRYVWRCDVLTEKEYHDCIEQDRKRISLLRTKLKGNVGSIQD